MISDQDVTKLKKVFVTKEEFADLKLEVGEINDKVDALDSKLDTKIDQVLNTLDHIAGAINVLREENAVGAHVFARHSRQIEAPAKHTGLKLAS